MSSPTRQGSKTRLILLLQRCCWCLEMETGGNEHPVVKVGDLDGLARIYSEAGGLIPESGEEILKVTTGWDANVSSPWRKTKESRPTAFLGKSPSHRDGRQAVRSYPLED